jgi:HSP20 family protein
MMAVSPYRPTTDLFRPFFDDVFGAGRGGWGGRMGDLLRVPESDVEETENEIRVTVELPGMKPEDIQLDLENNVLTISGEKQERNEEGGQGHTWHLSERRYGKFTRSFVLPRDVDSDRIDARYDHGVLNVTIPKSERARRRRIEVHDSGGSHEVGQGGGSNG